MKKEKKEFAKLLSFVLIIAAILVGQITIKAYGQVTTYTLSGPTEGDVTESSTNFTVTLGTGTLTGTVRITPNASNSDGTFTLAYIALTDAIRSGTFTYTPNLWGTRDISTTNDGGLTDPSAVTYVAKVQTGSSGIAPSGNRCPDLGGFDFFSLGPWWQEMGRDISSDPVSPFSDSLMSALGSGNIWIDWSTTSANGGNSIYGIPYNVVPGDQPLLPFVNMGSYGAEGDSGPSPYFAEMTIENFYDTSGIPPDSIATSDGADHHGLVLLRNETTGGIDKLYETYQLYSDDGGSTWGTLSIQAIFDLTTGNPRPEGNASSDAGGLPLVPLLVRYEEVARGEINHAIRCCISPAASRNRYLWPARHTAYSGSSSFGLPQGARLRLKQSWYDANRDSFSPLNQIFIDAMRHYGLIVADLAGGGLWVNGTNDERWTQAGLNELRTIPVSAFEVIDNIIPPVSITGPDSGEVNMPHSFDIDYIINGNSNFSFNMYFYVSRDSGTTYSICPPEWSHCSVPFDDTHRNYTVTFHPTNVQLYYMRFDYGGKEIIDQPIITFKALPPSGIDDSTTNEEKIPGNFTLYQNHPNPFRLSTTIRYFMHSEENVEITVYDKVGSKIRTLIKGKIPTGFQNVSWDGTNDKGEKVGSGVYFYKMKTTSGFTDNKKMTLLK